jgi:hemerythrin-like domain-containing protein
MKPKDNIPYDRRRFIGKGIALTAAAGLLGTSLIPGCKNEPDEDDEGQKVSPPEDLMQEHGLLNRVLLVYDTCRIRLMQDQKLSLDPLHDSATIIRTFVEDYHEKQEENYLFPRFRKANQQTALVDVLLQQHRAGRELTDQIIQLTKPGTRSIDEIRELVELLSTFNTMYRPHEAREDTVLFPAFRKLVSRNEYDSLGEEFEKNEHKLFGKDGFEGVLEKVANIEKSLGIYELAQFTPVGVTK